MRKALCPGSRGGGAVLPSAGEDGFTLIELMISLGLFALIAVAGLTMVNGIIGVQGRTETRLDRLAQLQRTMFVVTSDLDQISAGRISGGGGALSFTRAAPGAGGPPVALRYTLAGNTLVRNLGPLPQPLLTNVAGARWRFWDKQGWVDRWPIGEDEQELNRWPRAIEVEVQLRGPPSGTLRRLVILPEQLPPEPVE